MEKRWMDDRDRMIRRLFVWYAENARSFPWREAADPWGILVVEVMSQQTQLQRVTQAWMAFIDRWPTPMALADSPSGEVVGFWSEHRLGYNKRSVYLHESAQRIVDEYDGAVPSDPDELETLPGVGPYTANAVASMAFGTGHAVLDTNVRRVLYRVFDIEDEEDHYRSVLDSFAPTDEIGQWNEAIMELGGIACSKRPTCDTASCPWRSSCNAYLTNDFSAPDVQSQSPFVGSNRQVRGELLAIVREHEPLSLAELTRRLNSRLEARETLDRSVIRTRLEELAGDGLVCLTSEPEPSVHLPQ